MKPDSEEKTVIRLAPKPGCNKCYGTGWVGVDAKTKQRIQCRCVKMREVQGKKIIKTIQNKRIRPR